jgi:hypothetical protein
MLNFALLIAATNEQNKFLTNSLVYIILCPTHVPNELFALQKSVKVVASELSQKSTAQFFYKPERKEGADTSSI